MKYKKHHIAELKKILREMKKTECTFWACPTWRKPHQDMLTCRNCAAIQELAKVIREIENGE